MSVYALPAGTRGMLPLLEGKGSATHLGKIGAELYFEGISLGVNLLFQSVKTEAIVQIRFNS